MDGANAAAEHAARQRATATGPRVTERGYLIHSAATEQQEMGWIGESTGEVAVTVEDERGEEPGVGYTAVRIGDDTVEVGDVIYLRTDTQDEPCDIARVTRLCETTADATKMVTVQWYWRPEHIELSDTQRKRLKLHPREIFVTDTSDDTLLEEYVGKCAVVQVGRDEGPDGSIVEAAHSFFCCREYFPRGKVRKFKPLVPPRRHSTRAPKATPKASTPPPLRALSDPDNMTVTARDCGLSTDRKIVDVTCDEQSDTGAFAFIMLIAEELMPKPTRKQLFEAAKKLRITFHPQTDEDTCSSATIKNAVANMRTLGSVELLGSVEHAASSMPSECAAPLLDDVSLLQAAVGREDGTVFNDNEPSHFIAFVEVDGHVVTLDPLARGPFIEAVISDTFENTVARVKQKYVSDRCQGVLLAIVDAGLDRAFRIVSVV